MADVLTGAVPQAVSDRSDPEISHVTGDRELLGRFLEGGDEAAFTDLVQRYGRTVWGVCRRVLHQEQDAEDTFQAVFLILARKASSIRKGEAVGSWLYGVAYRVAMKARQTAGRRLKYETQAPAVKSEPEPASQAACRELQRLLDEEVHRLAEKYRKPFVLCCLEGMSKSEAALELGWKPGTVSGRLAEARKLLQSRLARRGVMLSAVLTASALAENSASAAVPPMLVQGTVKIAISVLANKAAAFPVSCSASALAEAFMRTTALAKVKAGILFGLIVAMLVVSSGLAALFLSANPQALFIAQEPQTFLTPPTPLGTPIDEQVFALAFSPDGKRLITAGALDALPGQIKMWDVATAKELYSVTRIPGVRGVAFAPDGQSFATADFGGALTLRDAKNGAELAVMRGHASGINAVAYSPNGAELVTASLDKTVKLWDVKLQKERRAFLGHTDMVLAVAYFHGSALFVSGGKDTTARIWDMASGKEKFVLRGHASAIEAVAVSPDDRLVAAAGWDQTVRLWDTATGQQTAVWKANEGPVLALRFSPSGNLLATGAGDGIVRLWDTKTQKEMRTFEGHEAAIRCLDFSRDGKFLASGSSDKTAKLWSLSSGKGVGTLQTHWSTNKPVVAIAYAPDGQLLAVATRDKSLHTRDAKTGDVVDVLLGHQGQVSCLAFAPDGQTIASGGEDKVLKLWDRISGQLKLTLTGHLGAVRALAFAPDGKTLASAGDDKTIMLWDPHSGNEIARLNGHEAAIRALAFAPGNTGLLASGSADRTIKLWDLTNQKESETLWSHEATVRALAFAPDGATLASAGEVGAVKLWDLRESRVRLTLKGHRGEVSGLAFSPGGQTLVSTGRDKTAIVWDPVTGRIRSTLEGHQDGVTCLAIDPMGNDLITGSSDTTLLRWRGGKFSEAVVLQANQQPDSPVRQMKMDATGGLPKSSSAREFYHSFKDSKGIIPELLRMGPEAEQRVSFEPAGLRITLPTGTNNDGPVVGVGTRFGVQGDFEITANFQILHLPSPADAGPLGTRLSIMTFMQTQQPSQARVTRAVRDGHNLFISWQSLWNSAIGKKVDHFKGDPAKADSGRLRLVRTGSLLSYYMAEGADEKFTLLAQYPTTEDGVNRVSLVGQTGGPKAKLDVIFTDLRIRADSLPGLEDTVSVAALETTDHNGLWGAGVIFGLILLSSIGVTWYFLRHIGRPGAMVDSPKVEEEPTGLETATLLLGFPCSGCGKNLRVKAALAGKKGRCSHCGQSMIVPQIYQDDTPAAASGGLISILKEPFCWLLLLLLIPGNGFAQARDHLAIDFRSGPDKMAPVQFFGPNASRVAKFGDQGLRFSLPEGRSDVNPVGAELPLRLHGDFEVVLGYKLLTIGSPTPPGGAGVQFSLLFDTPNALKAIISRLRKGPETKKVNLYEKVTANGEAFGANRIHTGPDGKEKYDTSSVRAASSSGRLKMIRKGTQIQFWAADGEDSFHLISTKEFGTADVRSVRMIAAANYRAVTLDVVFTDLVVDAEESTATSPALIAVPEAIQATRSKLLLPGFLSVSAAVTIGFLSLLWLLQRRRTGSLS